MVGLTSYSAHRGALFGGLEMKRVGFSVGLISFVLVGAIFALVVSDASARPASTRPAKAKVDTALKALCPKIVDLDPAKQFWKNNKPKRASSAINAPVIGYFEQMTLGNNAGVSGNGIGDSAATLYDSKAKYLSAMAPYPCRSDHCGGRVVSTASTRTSRRAAMSRTGSPVGYVKVGKTCYKILDIGKCYGNEVDKTRPLCNQIVG